jgi:penicillin-binding protein 2
MTPPKKKAEKELSFSVEALQIVRHGMETAVTHSMGTARRAALKGAYEMARLSVAGKTGSTQVRRISMAERRRGFNNRNQPWHWQDHALFTGYAPAHDPKVIVTTLVEHGGSGGKVAAPVARDIIASWRKNEIRKKNRGEQSPTEKD